MGNGVEWGIGLNRAIWGWMGMGGELEKYKRGMSLLIL